MWKKTQRVIIPGQIDSVTSPPISLQAFAKLRGKAIIPLGGGRRVRRDQCFWDNRFDTISVFAGVLVAPSVQPNLEDQNLGAGSAS